MQGKTSSKPHQITVDGRSYALSEQQLLALGGAAQSAASASSIELQLLFTICESGVVRNTVILIAELEALTGRFYSIEFIQWVLDSMNLNDWVRFRLVHTGTYHAAGDDIYQDIKPTPFGYLVAGYPPATVIIQKTNYHREPGRVNDATDFRNHPQWAQYSHVERMGIHAHCRAYPTHDHSFAFEPDDATTLIVSQKGVASSVPQAHNGGAAAPPGGESEKEQVVGRGPDKDTYQSPETIERIQTARRLLAQGLGVQEARKQTGFGAGTIQRLKDDPLWMGPTDARMARAAKTAESVKSRGGYAPRKKVDVDVNLKNRILLVLGSQSGPVENAEHLTMLVRQDGNPNSANIDAHHVVHALYDLQKLRKVEFKGGSSTRSSTAFLRDIKLYGMSWRQEANTKSVPSEQWVAAPAAPAPEPAPQSAETPPVAVAAAAPGAGATPAPTPGLRWPTLVALLGRGTKVRAAARLLREAGMDAAADLVLGEAPNYSPLEGEIVDLLEYLDRQGSGQPVTYILEHTKKD